MRDRDFTVIARKTVEKAIGEHLDGTPLEISVEVKNTAAVSRGRLGGLKGGTARAKKLRLLQLTNEIRNLMVRQDEIAQQLKGLGFDVTRL